MNETATLPCKTTLSKTNLKQIEWSVQNGLMTKNEFLPLITSFLWKYNQSIRIEYTNCTIYQLVISMLSLATTLPGKAPKLRL